MKTFLLAIFLFSFAIIGKAQTVQSSCDAPDSVKEFYQDDAAWLAYQYEQKIGSEYLDSVFIRKDLQDRFLKAILAVYNAVNLPTADTVTKYKFANDYYTIPHLLKSFRYYSMGIIIIIIDTTIPWQYRLSKKIFPTGNSRLDAFIGQYKIVFDSIYCQSFQPSYNYCSAITQDSYNMIVLDSLLNLATEGSLHAGPEYLCCDGDRIDGDIQKDSSVRLTFSFGWCDCLAGCGCRRFWDFTVFPDCSVRFDSSYGNPFPVSGIDTDLRRSTNLILYPNPASKKIIIETRIESNIEIFDVIGNTVQSMVSKEERTETDVSSLPKGIYYVRATNKKGSRMTAKFIKE